MIALNKISGRFYITLGPNVQYVYQFTYSSRGIDYPEN